MTSPPPTPRRPALFLDVDGTLLDLRARPEQVVADAPLIQLLQRVHARVDGALALVSGRAIGDLDRIFDPLRLPSAGLHGFEIRSGVRTHVVGRTDRDAIARTRSRLAAFVRDRAGLQLEDKGLALAVHFRAAPALEELVDAEVRACLAVLGEEFEVQPGAMVRELKPRGASKGTAIHALMAELPFRGRVPVAVGDDLTDLDAFGAAEALGGFGVAVGHRVDSAWRLPDPHALREWLERLPGS